VKDGGNKTTTLLRCNGRFIVSLVSTTTVQWSQQEVEQFVERAKQIYREKLAAILEPEHAGEIVAIAPESGDYFLGTNEIDARHRARDAGRIGPLYFLRVGSIYTYRLMSPRQ
jgi:hypothetical protein